MTATRNDWPAILAVGKTWVERHDTPPTLRQLFYALVSTEVIANSEANYKALSSRTAEARRRGDFPDLIDETRPIRRAVTYVDVEDFAGEVADYFRLDRTIGQDVKLVLGAEKRGMGAQLVDWFGDDYGVPVVTLGGYASQSLADEMARSVVTDGRTSVLLYAGDLDPSGENIEQDFVRRVGVFDKVVRVALTEDQVDAFDLPPLPGKATDSRAARFIRDHGALFQVEVDALDPTDLRNAFADALAPFVDMSVFRRVLADEQAQRAGLRRRLEQL